jgi:hypothetical protein
MRKEGNEGCKRGGREVEYTQLPNAFFAICNCVAYIQVMNCVY